MKTYLSILFVFIAVLGICQSSVSNKIELIGSWTLTDFNDPDKFNDTWEFKTDSVFNELKHKADGDATLFPDENGTWSIKGEKLRITITREDHNGVQVLYEKPQVVEFNIIGEGEAYVLTVITKINESDSKIVKLRLTRVQ